MRSTKQVNIFAASTRFHSISSDIRLAGSDGRLLLAALFLMQKGKPCNFALNASQTPVLGLSRQYQGFSS